MNSDYRFGWLVWLVQTGLITDQFGKQFPKYLFGVHVGMAAKTQEKVCNDLNVMSTSVAAGTSTKETQTKTQLISRWWKLRTLVSEASLAAFSVHASSKGRISAYNVWIYPVSTDTPLVAGKHRTSKVVRFMYYNFFFIMHMELYKKRIILNF